jgi:hypothetical protein
MAHRIETALISGEASAEVMLRRNDGEPVPFLVVGRRVTLDGKPHIVGVGTDLTERKFAERAIKRLNTELERRVAERTSQLSAAPERARIVQLFGLPMICVRHCGPSRATVQSWAPTMATSSTMRQKNSSAGYGQRYIAWVS